MKIRITAIVERQRALLYTQKAKKIAKRFYMQKERHFSKSNTISVMFLYTKSHILYVKQFFMKCSSWNIYKKHDTFCYGTFLYAKTQTLRKKQDNLRYVFMFKNPDTLHYAIFH